MTRKPASPAPSPLAKRRRDFRTGCAMAVALALAGNVGTAAAQSFLGTGEVVAPGDAFILAEGGSTSVFVNTEQTVINWQLPSSTVAGNPPEVFQLGGTTADFSAGSGINSFTVLNRILPFEMVGGVPVAVNRAAQFNGTVTSPANSSIWFYSPSGIVVGANATFNVGSLVLTSNDIDTAGGLYGSNGEIRFRGAASSLAPVEIQNGALINAGAGPGNYLAIVAPRIVQAGTISVDGQVALVAAEQADITINAGLLDIVVTQGTTDPSGIVHTGTSGGAASTASDDVQVMSLIAMPKNTALTMLLSGSIGYTPAVNAVDEGSSVVLSAGYAPDLSNGELAQNLGNINIGNTQFTSPVTGVATNAIAIAPVAGQVNFQQSADLTAFQSLSAVAEDGEAILAAQTLFLNANQGPTGGTVTIRAEGGTTGGDFTINGSLFVSASSDNSLFFDPDGGNSGTGGVITLEASGGRISADQINLDAFGLIDSSDGALGADGTGGVITASVSGGGSISAPSFSVNADGFGGFGLDSGGDGTGGTISLRNQGGTLDLALVSLSASAFAGNSNVQTGSAQSGSILIDIAGGTDSWTELYADANSFGGEAFEFGSVAGSAAGRADAVSLHIGSGATLNITGSAYLAADAYAGVNGNGNAGTAGGVSVLVDGGGALRVDDTFRVSADAWISSESLFFDLLTSPTLTGGTVNILASGGNINVHNLRSTADAIGAGAMDFAGNVTGGTNTVGVTSGGTISTFAAGGLPGFLLVSARAYGGNGPSPADAFGGTATLYADGGTLNFDDQILVSATAVSDEYSNILSGNGFAAQGGTASLELRGGGGSLSAVGITILADGDATNTEYTLAGDGRSGTGGTARLSVAAGTLVANDVLIRANGLGGQSGPLDISMPFQSGDGFGGTASLVTAGGSTTINSSLQLLAQGLGGGGTQTFSGQTAPLSGNGTGGDVTMLLSGGSLSTPSLLLDAQGFGGLGSDDLGDIATAPDGGDGTGGSAQIAMSEGSTAQLTAGDVQVFANGAGGAGGNGGGGQGDGGAGTAGSAGFNLADGRFTLGSTTVRADGFGGAGNRGGNGAGGTAAFLLNDSLAGAPPRTLGSLTLSGSGVGGASGTGPASTGTAGQVQLTANAGSAAGAVSVAGDFLAEALGDLAATGNGFVANIGGAPFRVGSNSTITTTRDVSMAIGTGAAFATQGTLTITTPRSVTMSGLVSSGSDAVVSADLGITMSDLNSGGTTLLMSSGGPVAVSNDLSSSGLVAAFGTSLDISSLGALTFGDASAGSGSFAVETAGDLVIGGIEIAGDITLSSTDGALTVGPITGNNVSLSAGNSLNAAAVTGTGTVMLASGGRLQASDTVSGAGITLTAGGDVQTDADVLSSAGLLVQAGGTFRAGGRVVGTDIVAESANLSLAPMGSIGERGMTQSIALSNSSPTSPTYIGGISRSGGYSIDAAEAARLFADNSISFGIANGTPGSVGDFIVGDLALAYGASGNIGSGGVLKILTPDRVAINGAVALTTSSNADRFSIDPTRIDIVTDTGSIVMQDNSGALVGQLELVGGTIAVASAAKLAEIADLSNPAAINAALEVPDATANDAGYLQAGHILFDADSAIYIANTGTSANNADRRGFTANRVSITAGSPLTHISINGVLLDSMGSPVTGLDTAQFVVINGTAGGAGHFPPFSTINGCSISQTCRGTERTETTKTKSDIEVPLEPEGNKPEFSYILEIEEREPEDLRPLIDEPVTGVGNDDLWNGACGPDSGTCPQGGDGE